MLQVRPVLAGPADLAASWIMLTCSCCGKYTVEEILLDRMRGAGVRRIYRLKQGGYVLAEAATLDELAVELDTRGVLMWPEDGCE